MRRFKDTRLLMKLRFVRFLFGLLLAFYTGCVPAQATNRPATVGVLSLSGKPDGSTITSFRAGLRAFGYIDNQNVRIEFRTAGG